MKFLKSSLILAVAIMASQAAHAQAFGNRNGDGGFQTGDHGQNDGRDGRGGRDDNRNDRGSYDSSRALNTAQNISSLANELSYESSAYNVNQLRLASDALIEQIDTNQQFCKVRKKAKDNIRIYKQLQDDLRNYSQAVDNIMADISNELGTLRGEFDLTPWNNYCD